MVSETKLFNKPVLLALGIIFFGHFLLLLNTGIYFDGWQLFHWFRNDLWEECYGFYSRLGMPLMTYWYWALAHVETFPSSYKLFSFIWFLCGALITYATLTKCRVLTTENRLWVILLAAFNTSMVTVIEETHFCYHSGYFLFQCAVLAFVHTESAQKSKHVYLRALSLGLFFLAFNYNALLTYYYGAWLIWLGFKWEANNKNLREIIKYALVKRLDFTVLPLVFWFWKVTFTPVHGDQVGYNTIQFGENIWGPLVRLPYVVLVQFIEAFANLKCLVVLLPTIGILVYVLRQTRKKPPKPTEKRDAICLFLCGAILFGAAAFPYVVSSKGFSIGLNGDRMNFLLSFPIAMLLVGGFSTLTSNPLILRGSLTLILSLFVFQTNHRYINWQVRAIKDEAIMHAIEKQKALDQASIFEWNDNIQLKDKWDDRYWYIPHQSTYLMAGLGGGMKWLGIPSSERTNPGTRFTLEEMQAFLRKFKLTYFADGIDLNGKQASITINPGEGFSDSLGMVTSYYRNKLRGKEELGNFLRTVVNLSIDLPLESEAGPS